MPDDDPRSQFGRARDGPLEQIARVGDPPRIRREQRVILLPDMDGVDAAAGVAAAAAEQPDEGRLVFRARLQHDLEIEQAVMGGDLRRVFGRRRVEGAGRKAEPRLRIDRVLRCCFGRVDRHLVSHALPPPPDGWYNA